MPESDNSTKFVQLVFPFIELPPPPPPSAEPAQKKRRRPHKRPNHRILNDMSVRYAVYGEALLAFVRANSELSAMLEAGIARLRNRKTYNLDPFGPSRLRRAITLRHNRRAIFLELARAALTLYVASTATPTSAFAEFPNRVITAFTAQCVREYHLRIYGDPDYDRA